MKFMGNNFNAITSFGLGIFETMPYYKGKIPFLNEHIERLKRGLLQLNATSPEIFPDRITEYVQKELDLTTGVIRIIARLNNTLELYLSPEFPYTIADYNSGFSLTIASSRKNEFSSYVNIKTLNYLENFIERSRAKNLGYNDALFLNTKGKVAETSSANIFILNKNTLFTPSLADGILPGIVRAEVIDFANASGYEVCEKSLDLDEMLNAEHVFLTNSLLCMMPVSQINSHPIARNSNFEKSFCTAFMKGYNS